MTQWAGRGSGVERGSLPTGPPGCFGRTPPPVRTYTARYRNATCAGPSVLPRGPGGCNGATWGARGGWLSLWDLRGRPLGLLLLSSVLAASTAIPDGVPQGSGLPCGCWGAGVLGPGPCVSEGSSRGTAPPALRSPGCPPGRGGFFL